MEGLPVHSIADGIVTNIIYEQSWGCLVAVQSRLRVCGTVTSFYGHLSRYIDVKVGQGVNVGDKIEEIATTGVG